MALRSICVFCGASPGRLPSYAAAARALAASLCERGLELVYGGARVGLMGVLADTMLANGGRVVGVIPAALAGREVAHDGLHELHVVDTMHTRKALMVERADAFVVLPGGFGTLDETFEVLTWAQLGLHTKPCGLLDVNGYFAPLLQFLDRQVAEGFVREPHRQWLLRATEPSPLLDALAAFTPPRQTKWIGRDDL